MECNNNKSATFKIGLNRQDRDKIRDYVLAHTNIKPTPIISVEELNAKYPPENYSETNKAYDDLYLIESGVDIGYLYFFDTNTMLWTKSILYEDSEALNKKQDKDMIDWGTMPTEITDKNTFYKEVSKVFATTTQSIYMFGTPEELQRVWDIWGKPTGLKATHCYIAIKSLSNKSNRHAFIIWVFASNYGNPYFRIVNGYNGAYTGTDDKGWVNVNKLVESGSYTLPKATETELGGIKAKPKTNEDKEIAIDENGKAWYKGGTSGGSSNIEINNGQTPTETLETLTNTNDGKTYGLPNVSIGFDTEKQVSGLNLGSINVYDDNKGSKESYNLITENDVKTIVNENLPNNYENWTFTLEDGSTITKQVLVKKGA